MTSSQSERDPSIVEIDYTNWRGERAKRIIQPGDLWFGNSIHHEGAQWFLRAAAEDKEWAERDFAMKDIHAWSVLV